MGVQDLGCFELVWIESSGFSVQGFGFRVEFRVECFSEQLTRPDLLSGLGSAPRLEEKKSAATAPEQPPYMRHLPE